MTRHDGAAAAANGRLVKQILGIVVAGVLLGVGGNAVFTWRKVAVIEATLGYVQRDIAEIKRTLAPPRRRAAEEEW